MQRIANDQDRVVGAAGLLGQVGGESGTTRFPTSVAVLPLENLSPDAEHTYFAAPAAPRRLATNPGGTDLTSLSSRQVPLYDSPMQVELIDRRHDLLIRRLVLEPGEATPWHVDRSRRFSVVVRGKELTIEFRDAADHFRVPVRPAQAEWEDPEPRAHRAINTGDTPYEEVVMFFVDGLEMDPQPHV